MHTSEAFAADDFQYRCPTPGGSTQVDFDAFCPAYSQLDRVGVVCPHIEDGVFHSAYALLGITTAFYDIYRARGEEFFNYPQHFAIIAANAAGISTRGGHRPLERKAIGASWGNLDVWPDSQWIMASATATNMLERVFTSHISRLFWPEDYFPEENEAPLPTYMRDLLPARLKSVFYYNSKSPTIEIRVSQKVEDMVQTSVDSVLQYTETPTKYTRPQVEHELPYMESYRQVSTDEFLATVDHYFAVAQK